MNTPYITIRDFCKKRSTESLYERILLHKFYKDFYELVDEQKHKYPDKEPSDADKDAFQKTLLSENSLLGNLRAAEDEIAQALNVKTKKIEKFYARKSFWGGVWASMVASFLFTVVLVLFLTFAQKQVLDWFEAIYKNNKKIEQQITDNKNGLEVHGQDQQ